MGQRQADGDRWRALATGAVCDAEHAQAGSRQATAGRSRLPLMDWSRSFIGTAAEVHKAADGSMAATMPSAPMRAAQSRPPPSHLPPSAGSPLQSGDPPALSAALQGPPNMRVLPAAAAGALLALALAAGVPPGRGVGPSRRAQPLGAGPC